MRAYTKEYYRVLQRKSLQSAREIVPLILQVLKPKRVIDVGCGLGEWLSVFREHQVLDVWGVDRDWVDPRMLLFPEKRFRVADLQRPLRIRRRFDLVICLEVAEHLPKRCASGLVKSLTRLGPIVLFSAAIPVQGGPGHLNEQWLEYWAAHFLDHDYVPVDWLRGKIWQNNNVAWWYKQNTLLFARRQALTEHPVLQRAYQTTAPGSLSRIHPKMKDPYR